MCLKDKTLKIHLDVFCYSSYSQSVWLTLLPTLILNTERRNPALGARDYVGYGLWLTGFLLEVIADMQKSIFKADPANEVKYKGYQLTCHSQVMFYQIRESKNSNGCFSSLRTTGSTKVKQSL